MFDFGAFSTAFQTCCSPLFSGSRVFILIRTKLHRKAYGCYLGHVSTHPQRCPHHCHLIGLWDGLYQVRMTEICEAFVTELILLLQSCRVYKQGV